MRHVTFPQRRGPAVAAAIIALLLVGPGSIAAASVAAFPAGAAPVGGPTPSLIHATSHPTAAPQTSSAQTPIARVVSTVDLLNGATYSGNYRPPNGLGPDSVQVFGGDAFVTDVTTSNVLVVSLSSDSVVAAIPVGSTPLASTLDSSTGTLYVVNELSSNISVINATTHTVTRTISVAGYLPDAVAYDPMTGVLFVGETADGRLYAYNASSGAETSSIGLGGNPVSVAFDPRNDQVVTAVITPTGQAEVQFANASTLFGSVTTFIGAFSYLPAFAVAVDDALDSVFVTNASGRGLLVLNATTGSVSGNLTFGGTPGGIAIDAARDRVFETDQTFSNLTIVNASALTVLSTVRAGAGAMGIGVDPTSGQVVIANEGANNLTILSGPPYDDRVWIPVGIDPLSVAEAPTTGIAAVTIPDRSVILFVNGTTHHVSPPVVTPYGPDQVVWSPLPGRFYSAADDGNITSFFSNNGTIAGHGSAPAFTSSLAVDYSYGQLFAVGSASLTGSFGPVVSVFGLSSLGYLTQYSIPNTPGTIALDPATYSLWIPWPDNGGIAQVNITNGHTDGTTTLEGNPEDAVLDAAGHRVYVSLGSANAVAVLNSTTGAFVTQIEVGQYPEGMTLDAANHTLYVTNYNSNNLSVIDTLNDTVLGSIAVGDGPSAVSADDPHGAIYVTNTLSGTVSVLAAPLVSTYAVTFTESGLSGQSWTVTLGGQAKSATGTVLTFAEPNGTYPFSVAGPAGFTIDPASGSAVVSGSPTSERVSFTPIVAPSYTVSFHESGLANGTSWTVTFNGTAASSATAWINFTAKNGTFAYAVGSVIGYTSESTGSSVTVAGSNRTVQVNYTSLSEGSAPPNTGGFTSFELIAIGLVIAVVAAAGVGYALYSRRVRSPPSP